MDWMSETFEVELLSEIMQNRIEEIDAGTILLSEGSYVKKIPLLLDGSVRVSKSSISLLVFNRYLYAFSIVGIISKCT